jgi:hypothetical protein
MRKHEQEVARVAALEGGSVIASLDLRHHEDPIKLT